MQSGNTCIYVTAFGVDLAFLPPRPSSSRLVSFRGLRIPQNFRRYATLRLLKSSDRSPGVKLPNFNYLTYPLHLFFVTPLIAFVAIFKR